MSVVNRMMLSWRQAEVGVNVQLVIVRHLCGSDVVEVSATRC